MPTFRVTLPDGRKARVTANSFEEADAAVSEMLGQSQSSAEPPQTAQPQKVPQSVASNLGRVTGGLGMIGEGIQSAAEVPMGLAQFGANMIPGVNRLAPMINKAVAEQRAGYEAQRMEEAQAKIDALKADPKWQALAADPKTAGVAQYEVDRLMPGTTAAGLAGTVAGGFTVPLGLLGRAGGLVSPVASRVAPTVARVAAPIVKGAATGAVASQAQTQPGEGGEPVTPEQFRQEAGERAIGGAAFGAALPVLGKAAEKVIGPWGGADVQRLRELGVRPTVGQTVGGFARNVEEKARSIPGLGNAIAYGEVGAQKELVEGLANKALGNIGEKLSRKGMDSQSLIKESGDRVSNFYDKATAMWQNRVAPDPKLWADVSADIAMTRGLPQEVESNVTRFVQNDLARRAANGIDGRVYKDMDSAIAGRIASATNQEEKRVYSELRASLRDFAGRKSPQVADLLKQADSAWADIAVLESAGARAKAGAEGPSISNLATAAKLADKSVRKRATARGEARNQADIDAAARVLGYNVADSGTAGRQAIIDAGRGFLAGPAAGAAAWSNLPVTVASLLAASTPYAARRTVSDLMSGGGSWRTPVSQFVGRTAQNPRAITIADLLRSQDYSWLNRENNQ